MNRALRSGLWVATPTVLLWWSCLIWWSSAIPIAPYPPLYSPPDYILATFESPRKAINFTHMAVDPLSDRVYVGATNWLYQLNSSLGLEASVQTGPIEDDYHCSASDCSGVIARPTNNFNKVLLIDQASRSLIVCGSVRQGSCRRHHLNDIKRQEPLVSIPVASNDENSSTVAFIGPARYLDSPEMRVMYVATTNSRKGPYRDMVPSICSRSLDENDRLFSIIEQSFSETPRVDISSHLRDYYVVQYVDGFHLGDFAYFATLQRKSHLRALEEWGYITRLARVCISDPAYNTYTEVTLQCLGVDGINYNLLQDAAIVTAGTDVARELKLEVPDAKVLIGVFVASKDHTLKLGTKSAICVYSVADIEQKFTENVHMCYNGSVLTRNMDYIAGSINQCPEPGKAGNVLNFCKETVKLNGSVPISARAAVEYANESLTALSVVIVEDRNMAFAGTAAGNIKMLLLNGASDMEEITVYEAAPGEKILPNMYVDLANRYLLAASLYRIQKIRLEKCEKLASCGECLTSGNAFCGWCSLENRCAVRSECHNTTWSLLGSGGSFLEQRGLSILSSRWLSMGPDKCIDFRAIRPDKISINDVRMVELVVHQLPHLPYGATYQCVFGKTPAIQASVTHDGLACLAPVLPLRPHIPKGKDHVVVDLAVRSSETQTDFIHRPFTFFDCTVHKTCKSCVMSNWPCNWCIHDNRCTPNAANCSKRVIIGESNEESSLIKGRQHCPSFSIDNEILIPHEYRKEISVEVKNLLTPLEGFQCEIEIEGSRERVRARIRDNKVVCAENIYSYQSESALLQAQLTVLWNGDTFVDKTNLSLYKCPLLGSHGGRQDCSLCLTRDPKYQCSWCGGVCNYGAACTQPVSTSCPPPRIDWIHPLSGPVEGGTLVTIEGSNLGTSEEEIWDKILIGGVACIPIEYNVSVRVVCRTQASLHGPHAAIVVIGNRAGITKAQEKFFYKRVELTSSYPKVGPRSGGTRLYLNGTNLNVGSHVEVWLDDIPCVVERSLATSNQMSCRTSLAPMSNYRVSQLVLRVDGVNLTLPQPFVYLEDPSIAVIQPLKSFVSGGRHIRVYGENLHSIQQPRMIVYNDQNQLNESVCHVLNDTVMECPSPSVAGLSTPAPPTPQPRGSLFAKQANPQLPQDAPFPETREQLRLHVGFIMDDVKLLKELRSFYPLVQSDIVYVQDPKLFPFDNDKIKLYKGESLVIEGENLLLATDEEEVNVTIGTQRCNLTSLSMSQLVCLPPEDQPLGTDETGRRTENQLPAVVVRIGRNIRYDVGHLRYEVVRFQDLPTEALGAMATGGAILVLLSVAVLAVLRHKSSQAEREYKRIQLQMDTLENSVRSECKQAFAELQTDMTDLNNDILTTGIPTLEHKTYMMKVFFPGVPADSPILQEFKQMNSGPTNEYEIAMAIFEQLVNTKPFLLTFIETLEEQKTFSIRDKVNVASLLMIILLDKMDYAADILRELLYRLIAKYVDTKHPQLMLRRTESVVEKLLTNFMALCMYSYIKDCAGRSLFLLFSAIKHQIEKGPVDAITHDARYTLSEERLLREQIVYMPVVIQVIHNEQAEKVVCRVNDCDTITQVKVKILDALYKNTPFSLRPPVSTVQLEWRQPRGVVVILEDEDSSTKVVGGYKRINTLAHYGVRDTALMSMSLRGRGTAPRNGTLRNNNYESIYSTLTSCTEKKYWHLVKPVEQGSPQDQRHKAIPEIFLTRLLSTKGTVQKFVDDFLSTIFTVSDSLPLAVKWLFDLLDDAASRNGIIDPEVPHAWKSNSLPLRFWVNLVKNPDFIFDVEKTPIVDSSLSVIAQTLMDACCNTEHRLGKDSPSNKLLFARDIPTYRRMVQTFYQDLRAMPPVTPDQMHHNMRRLSAAHAGEVDTLNALKELYIYVTKYNDQILFALETDPVCENEHLAQKLDMIASRIHGERTC